MLNNHIIKLWKVISINHQCSGLQGIPAVYVKVFFSWLFSLKSRRIFKIRKFDKKINHFRFYLKNYETRYSNLSSTKNIFQFWCFFERDRSFYTCKQTRYSNNFFYYFFKSENFAQLSLLKLSMHTADNQILSKFM